jgi:endonuclease/exonuclease/phosphatase family metal-dependent hydrolase
LVTHLRATISALKLLSWNLAGYTGKTKERQLAAILELSPDLIALQEVVLGSIGHWREALGEAGFDVVTSDPHLLEAEGPLLPHKGYRMGRRKNLNLIASRTPIKRLKGFDLEPGEGFPEKYLAGRTEIEGVVIDVHNVHTPPGSTTKMLKVDYWEQVLERVNLPTAAARILCGDFNSPWSEDNDGFVAGGGRSDPDEERRWKEAELGFLEHRELRDVYRANRSPGERFAFSHMRGGKTPCRYDHVYVSTEFQIDACCCDYRTDFIDAGMSDHAAVLASLKLG